MADPGPDELLVRVRRSQISAGSEMNGFRGRSGRRPTGYTTAGIVERVGPGVKAFREGQRVLAYGNHATHCLVDLGDRVNWRAHPQLIKEGLTDEQACFAVLGDVALHGVRRAALQIDESVVVFGAGVVGQLTVQFARLSGAYPIIVIDLVQRRLDLARDNGATHTINAAREDVIRSVHTITQGSGVQTVFQCAPVASLLQTAMTVAADRGKVVMTASAPGVAEIGLQVELLRRELSILGVYESGLSKEHVYWPWTRQRNREVCFRLIGTGRVNVDEMVTHVVPPDRADEMFRMLAAGPGDWMSVYFAWG